MIPLSRWLSDHESATQFAFPPEDDAMEVAVALPDAGSGFDGAVQGREKELEDALKAAEEALESERHSQVQREQQLREELGGELTGFLKRQIDDGLLSMRQELETAICDILQPFLKDQSTLRANAALMGLIDDEIIHGSEPLLELRAPRELHDLIGPSLEQMNLPCSLSEGRRIELAFASRMVRFEQLASRWHQIISESGA